MWEHQYQRESIRSATQGDCRRKYEEANAAGLLVARQLAAIVSEFR
jgi:hypothetical protein